MDATACPLVEFAYLPRCPLRNSDVAQYLMELKKLCPGNAFSYARDADNGVSLFTAGNLGDAHEAYVKTLYWLNRKALERFHVPQYSAFNLKHNAS